MIAADGEAKLLDLGLGRLSYDPARVTESGYLVGAPFYMSPERLTAIETANESCDIWSFGVTFYEWICGYHPFYDDDGDRMIGNIIDAVPADLADVPAHLNQTILRALEKDPSQRYRSFGELLADLQPLISDLKREESEALMAEALKQTDSGRRHEARRIARQLRDMDQPQAPVSQIFGISEPELETQRFAERSRPAAMAPVTSVAQPLVAAATVGSAALAAAVDTPEPAPLADMQDLATAKAPPRPERTAPKIPTIGTRNGSTTNGENGSATGMHPPMAAAAAVASSLTAAGAEPAVVHEMDTSPRSDAASTEAIPNDSNHGRTNARRSAAQPAAAPPQQTVRILEMGEPNGFPWVKLLAFAVPALLMIGALALFLQPTSKLKSVSSQDAKEISRNGRVIKSDVAKRSDHGMPPSIDPVTTTPAPATATRADGTPVGQDPLDPEAPRIFDPKSLTGVKSPAPPRRREKGPLAGIVTPSLAAAAGSDGTYTPGLPLAVNAPPPPAAPVVTPPPAVTKTDQPALTPSESRGVESIRETANQSGGQFSQAVLMHTVQPVYPPAAVQRKEQGTVRFQATIAKDGSVKNIQLLSGNPLLNVAARRAVSQWRFRPAMLNGKPIEVTQSIVVNFNLSDR
jgi:TonB family protein